MSKLESLEELRDYASVYIESTKVKSLHDRVYDLAVFADEIEAEIERDYMRLPVDADGLPIHVGDVMEFGENRNQGIIKALNEHMVIAFHVDDGCTNYAKYGLLWGADACRHVKQSRTLEDVLVSYRFDAQNIYEDPRLNGNQRVDELEALDGKVADEIRELLGSDGEC